MAKFKLHWKDGTVESVVGDSISDAFRRAGYGGGAPLALDYWSKDKGVDVMVVGVFPTMDSKRAFEVHLANCRSWSSQPDGLPSGVEGWLAAGRMVMYQGQDAEKVAGFRRALLHWGADPETVRLSIPKPI